MRGGIFLGFWRVLASAGALFLALTTASRAATLYSTSFGNPPFNPSAFYWAGMDGWLASDPSNGSAAVGTTGGVVYLGHVQPAGTLSAVWRPFNLDPVELGVPIVKIRTRLAIFHSTNGYYDGFGFGIYNRLGKFVCGVFFDNWTGLISYNSGFGLESTGLYFADDVFIEASLTLNFATNRASLSFYDAAGAEHPAFANRTLNQAGTALDFGEFDYLWFLNSSGTAGDNAMVIDALSVEAQANPSLVIAHGKTQRTKGDTCILRGGQAAEDDVRIEWKSKTQRRWTPVRGSSTGWTIHLRKLVKGRNVVQLRMLDALGRTIDQQSVNVLRK